jgi:beta-1,4-mannosyl-glycoprotein beta-1,4-N-acetylglucosaminyltransferase
MLLRLRQSYRKRWQKLFLFTRQHWRRCLLFVSTLYIFLLVTERKHPFTHHAHTITQSTIDLETNHAPEPPIASETNNFLPLELAKELCSSARFPVYPKRERKRKIYDLFLLNTELDWLEIRLHTLAAEVDYFVIIESPLTFTGLQKPLILKDNWEQFKELHGKIIHHVLQDPPKNAKRTWDIEDYQRNAMFAQVIPFLTGEQKAEKGDVLIVADVDEIPRPSTLMVLRNCDIPARVTLRSKFYYYGFQWMHKGEEWEHPQATLYAGPKSTIKPADLRNGEGGWNRLRRWWDKTEIWNSGWHCSTCFSTIEAVLGKMGSFSHTGLNQEVFRDRTRTVDRVRKGLDLWDREGEDYNRIEGNEDIPDILKSDREKWKYLLDRDGSNAGFTDYGPEEDAGE